MLYSIIVGLEKRRICLCLRRSNDAILTFGEVVTLEPDIGFSVRYDKIIPVKVINAFKQGIFNIHGGILPEYRGSYCNINALINNETEYGVTALYRKG